MHTTRCQDARAAVGYLRGNFDMVQNAALANRSLFPAGENLGSMGDGYIGRPDLEAMSIARYGAGHYRYGPTDRNFAAILMNDEIFGAIASASNESRRDLISRHDLDAFYCHD
jgi:hypothetical protein